MIITRSRLLVEIKNSQFNGKPSKNLLGMLNEMSQRLSDLLHYPHGEIRDLMLEFTAGYVYAAYIDFDWRHSKDPFAYFAQVIYTSFVIYKSCPIDR